MWSVASVASWDQYHKERRSQIIFINLIELLIYADKMVAPRVAGVTYLAHDGTIQRSNAASNVCTLLSGIV